MTPHGIEPAAQPAPRYAVRTEMPAITRGVGLVAWVHDARHPDYPIDGASCCWCQDIADAKRIAAALNRDEMFRRALREQIAEKVVGEIEHGERSR